MKHLVLIATMAAAAACTGDETLSAYGASGKVWHLVSIDGQPFPASASLAFPAAGEIAGKAPCNSFHGKQTAPYPWFETGSLAVTRAACSGLQAEAAFLQALQTMTLAEISGEVLILSNDEGRKMLFKAGG